MLRKVNATRYVTPLREGGSLPAIIEADDQGLYVLKFRGAGQGARALIAELIAGEIARALGLLVPEIVFVELDPGLARSEPDSEIQSLIRDSAGLNLALDYLPGSLAFDPILTRPDSELASAIVWFDGFVSNVDRTPRNTNMLMWHQRLWLIDHGASLYFQYAGSNFAAHQHSPFRQIRDHVLLRFASRLQEVDAALSSRLTRETLEGIVSLVPESWLEVASGFESVTSHREAFAEYLWQRLTGPRAFVEEAIDARATLL